MKKSSLFAFAFISMLAVRSLFAQGTTITYQRRLAIDQDGHANGAYSNAVAFDNPANSFSGSGSGLPLFSLCTG